ncbi:hypothetical protein K1719_032399 [Acacia pycnantha]|nr:hypothetical protein K1719_032399 [Acacia pycnantha]
MISGNSWDGRKGHHSSEVTSRGVAGIVRIFFFDIRTVAYTLPVTMRSKDRISYFYDGDVGSVYFGPNHPMKPHRLCMTHHLVLSYELHNKMEIYRPDKAYPVELAQFHSADYVEFLHRITPDTQHLFLNELAKCLSQGYHYSMEYWEDMWLNHALEILQQHA